MTVVPLPALTVDAVSFTYGSRHALDGVTFAVQAGEIFGLLGPNGGGKTTLFRLIATLVPPQQGTLRLWDVDLARDPAAARRKLGVTFQSPSVDGKLTVRENLVHQGQLYGMHGAALAAVIEQNLTALGLADRRHDRVDTLSGGLRRRVELAKTLLHAPQFLLLDEPSTGLDPGARRDLWEVLFRLRETGTTVLVTTHLMEEAEHCDRLAILDHGRIVALETPAALKDSVGGDCLTMQTTDPTGLSAAICARWPNLSPRVLPEAVRIEHPQALELLGDIARAFPERITAIGVAKPTLEDVFLERTGHRFWETTSDASQKSPSRSA